LRTHLLFFPLWLGYVLVVDGWTEVRTGTSLLRRSPAAFAARFVLSVPVWWLFELVDVRLRNWEYQGREHFSDLEFALYSSLSFSTVMPAVLGTTELVASFRWCRRLRGGPRLRLSRFALCVVLVTGLLGLAAMLAWPEWLYPLVWVSGVFVLEPWCALSGRRSLSQRTARGDWSRWTALWTAGLVCGFFWELWNAGSWPRWTYHTPGLEGVPRLFEMPLPGYLGYLPFALELFLVESLCRRGGRRGSGHSDAAG
jgi:hypothetical protein